MNNRNLELYRSCWDMSTNALYLAFKWNDFQLKIAGRAGCFVVLETYFIPRFYIQQPSIGIIDEIAEPSRHPSIRWIYTLSRLDSSPLEFFTHTQSVCVCVCVRNNQLCGPTGIYTERSTPLGQTSYLASVFLLKTNISRLIDFVYSIHF